jgi:acyl-CoA synthetase (AMP-forming)/AMP-acid ligase II
VSIEAVIRGPDPPGQPRGPDTLPAFLAEVADRYGDRTALVTRYGRWSYRELHGRSVEVASGLRRHGVKAGDRIAVSAPNGEPWISVVFGALRLGAVPVLLHVLLTVDDIDEAVALTGCRFLVSSRAPLEEYLARHPVQGDVSGPRADPPDRLAAIVRIGGDGPCSPAPWTAVGDAQPTDGCCCELPRPHDDALILFTSGTSGAPKAVLHEHLAPCLQYHPWVRAQGITGEDVVFTAYPFCWSSGFVRSLCATLSIGATLVTIDRFDPETVLKMMEKEAATLAVLPAAHLEHRLLEAPGFAALNLASLRTATPTLAGALGIPSLGYTGYGMTETFTLITLGRAEESGPPLPPGWVGKPLEGWTIRVTDVDTGRLLRRGEVGRIEVRGPSLMREYIGRPRSDYMTEDGFFRTPDSGFVDDDGALRFHGRLDDVIRISGANVSTTEVEQALVSHPDIRIAVALGVPHPRLGQALVAGVVPNDEDLDEADIVAWLRTRLAGFKVPRRVLVLHEDELRFTVSQKVQRSHLRDLALSRLGTTNW